MELNQFLPLPLLPENTVFVGFLWGQDRAISQSFHQKCVFSFVTVLLPLHLPLEAYPGFSVKAGKDALPVQLLCVSKSLSKESDTRAHCLVTPPHTQ